MCVLFLNLISPSFLFILSYHKFWYFCLSPAQNCQYCFPYGDGGLEDQTLNCSLRMVAQPCRHNRTGACCVLTCFFLLTIFHPWLLYAMPVHPERFWDSLFLWLSVLVPPETHGILDSDRNTLFLWWPNIIVLSGAWIRECAMCHL